MCWTIRGVKSRWGRNVLLPPWGPASVLYNGYPVCTLGVKQSGVSLTTHPPSSADVKDGVVLELYSPLGPSWPVIEWHFLYFALPYLCRCVSQPCSTSNSAHYMCEHYMTFLPPYYWWTVLISVNASEHYKTNSLDTF